MGLGLPEQPLTEATFLKLVRKLKLLDVSGDKFNLTEGNAVFLWATCPFVTSEDFKQRLERVHEEERLQREDREAHAKRAAQLKKNRAFIEFKGGIIGRRNVAGNSWRQDVHKDVTAWSKEAADIAQAGGQARSQDIMRRWELEARSGKSQGQLQEYITLLESQLQHREKELQDVQAVLDGDHWKLCSLQKGWEASPSASADVMQSSNFNLTGGLNMDQTARQCQGAAKAKRLIQAAAIGDVASLQSLLKQRVDANIVGWNGATPLMSASRHGREGALQILLQARADVNRTDSHGRTAA